MKWCWFEAICVVKCKETINRVKLRQGYLRNEIETYTIATKGGIRNNGKGIRSSDSL